MSEVKFNNTEMPKLKRGEVKKYIPLGVYDWEKRRMKKYVTSLGVPAKDQILDENGEPINIGFIVGYEVDGSPKYGNIDFEGAKGNILSVRGSSAQDQKKYGFMALSNYNASNPNRDQNITPLYEEFDEAKGFEDLVSKRRKKADALRLADEMSDGEVRNWFYQREGKASGSIMRLRAKLGDIIEKNPDEFLNSAIVKDKDVSGIIEKAKEEGVIEFDKKAAAWMWSQGGVIFKVSKAVGAKIYDELVDYLTNSDKGLKTLEEIKSKLD